ncbi:MAG: hypothetical protein IME98_05010, partial [Proteobacteria bacterium]|nr:hypothetical protein [Pseudomonadota bacterium]
LRELHGASGTVALIDSSSIVVTRDSVPVLYSYVSSDLDLRFALAGLAGGAAEVEGFYSTEGGRGYLDELGLENKESDPYNDDNINTHSLLRLYEDGSEKDPMNFRKGEFVDKSKQESTRKSVKLAAVLIILLAVFWSVNIYSKVSGSAGELVKIERRLESVYSKLFSDESVVDPFYQMEIKVKELREERAFIGGGLDVLGTLKGLGQGASAIAGKDGKLKLFEVKMHSARVLARGEAGGFENADKFKETLGAMPVFKDISLTDVKKKSAGGVSFSIALTLEDDK